MMVEQRASRAITLVEVLVVTAIVGFLLALTLMAVHSSREAARRAGCASNLSQFGKGLAGYASTHNRYPKDGYRASWSFLVELLPHMDQSALFNSINFTQDAYDAPLSADGRTARQTLVPYLLCPSDRSAAIGPIGWTSYAGNRGTGVQKHGYNGAFALHSEVTNIGMFVDGTSQTSAMSEWSLGTGDTRSRDRSRVVFETPVRLTAVDQFEDFRSACHHLNVMRANPSIRVKGSDWTIAEFGNSLYNHILIVNDLSCLNKTAVQQGAWTAGSQHFARGANVLFVDGHVQWIREEVSRVVWEALGSRNGREVLDGIGY